MTLVVNTVRIAIFDSNYETLKAEKYFKESKISFRTAIPPKKFFPGCRMGLEFQSRQTREVRELCQNMGLRLKGVYTLEGDNLDA